MPRSHNISSHDLRTLSSLVGGSKSKDPPETIRLAMQTINGLRADLDTAGRTCTQLRSQRDNVHNHKQELKSNKEALERAVKMLEEKLARLATINSCLKAEREADQREHGKLEDEHSKLQADHAALQAANTRVHRQLNESMGVPNASWNECVARAAELAKSEGEHAPCNNQILRTQEEANKKISAARERRDSAEAETALVTEQKQQAMKL
ncbi:uncharacterized protein APUU_80884S [Aspergillus puulaauensis]|uniref:Uncharacterized protein n=1 Tax=Aspergillus puulaauensis TaxID=1220207 RepID=A0A7R8ATM8_9EURO|nr:uncharacterized protein APUU_80884S [Aspergillus puulaauensis]BCS30581.1 hypothetical protein APUU_80884S [Aspergillus puulaauensis]